MRTTVTLIAALATAASFVYGQGGDSASLQQSVRGKFALTEVAKDRTGVVNPGTLLTLQQDNLLLYSSACPSSPLNTYKNGKMSQSVGHNFMRNLGGSMQMPGNATTASCPQRRFARGTKVWVTKIDVRKDGIVFQLYSTSDNDLPYYGDLELPFEKGAIPAPDHAFTMIAEVLRAEAGNSTNSAQGAQESNGDANAGQGSQQDSLPGLYRMQQTGARLQLNPDGSFSVHAASGQVSPGHFTVNGDTLALTYLATGRSSVYTIRGGKIYANTGLAWVREAGQPPAPAPLPPVLKLPATYAGANNSADRLQLNADNTFSLDEDGQSYQGTFVANGNTVELNISGGAKSIAKIQGNSLTDTGGQVWVLK